MYETLGIAAPLGAALEARGFEKLTPVQEAMLDEDLRGQDLLVSAQTGSGKTVAFGLALADDLLDGNEQFSPARKPLTLIVAPTRELAVQVGTELQWLYGNARARFASCIGGMAMRNEVKALRDGAHFVVGTPGRLRDHISRGSLDMSEIRAVVLDEADEMLNLGFREDLEFILENAPKERRTLMFSATVAAPIARLAKRYQRDAQRIALKSKDEQHGDIAYKLMPVAPRERDNAVINTLLYFDTENAIVFCQTREAVRHLTARLTNRGFPVVSLSGELSQAERTNGLQAMRDGRARVCVATDVAARGIDLPNLDLVIHADLPNNGETLQHRSGRTGRAGRKGTAVVIAPQHRLRSAERILQSARITAGFMQPPNAERIAEQQKERMLNDAAFTADLDDEGLELATQLVEKYSPNQLANAWVQLARKDRPAPEELSAVVGDGPRASQGERPEARFKDGVWFSLSMGRNKRADPRWLLPIICRAGDVTRAAIGSIRILENESRFEVAAENADMYEATLKAGGGLEKGSTITRMADGDAPEVGGGSRSSGKPRPHRGQGDRRNDGDDSRPARNFKPRGDGERGKPRGDGERGRPRGDGERGKPRGDGERGKPRGGNSGGGYRGANGDERKPREGGDFKPAGGDFKPASGDSWTPREGDDSKPKRKGPKLKSKASRDKGKPKPKKTFSRPE